MQSPRAIAGSAERLVTLDLIRGVAVLGILAINIAGFAGPSINSITPSLPHQAGLADEAAWAFGFVFFEGKMRALFAILFGASLSLFCERIEAIGGNGELLQVRRLSWLMLFGTLHDLLLWWGDILFVYATCGIVALLSRQLSTRLILGLALAILATTHIWEIMAALPVVHAEEAVRLGTATIAQQQAVLARLDLYWDESARELALYTSPYLDIVITKLRDDPFWLFTMASSTYGEILPLMMLGMVLHRHGFFAGTWPARRMKAVATFCTFAGLVLTLAALNWAWPRHFPPIAMYMLISHGLVVPHVLTAIGYAAILVLAAPALARTRIGQRLIAAGRMAFSNYICTSVVMTAIFYGWGFDLFGRVGPAGQSLFVALGWTLMLAWSEPWLGHCRRGPLEWLWRSLVIRKLLDNRRNSAILN